VRRTDTGELGLLEPDRELTLGDRAAADQCFMQLQADQHAVDRLLAVGLGAVALPPGPSVGLVSAALSCHQRGLAEAMSLAA